MIVFTRMRQSMNIFIGSISLADMIICGYIMPWTTYYRSKCLTDVNSITCTINGFLFFVCAGIANFNFMFIAINRRYFILNKMRYNKLFTNWKIIIYSCIIWTIWFGFGLILNFFNSFHYIPNSFTCFYWDDYSPILASVIFTVFGVAVPSLVATCCYVTIFYNMIVIKRKITQSISINKTANENIQHNSWMNKEMRSILSALVTFIIFNSCWTPYCVHVYIDKYQGPINPIVHKIITWMAMINSSMSPIIHGALHSKFRVSMLKLLTWKCNTIQKFKVSSENNEKQIKIQKNC
uniref:GCR150 n=1 Tax=Schmidtea mediterranea TaxID=79327 RepID=A0A193KUR1_SCHMD|nr:GCR150 [Schmidtea mediterranea]